MNLNDNFEYLSIDIYTSMMKLTLSLFPIESWPSVSLLVFSFRNTHTHTHNFSLFTTAPLDFLGKERNVIEFPEHYYTISRSLFFLSLLS